MRLLVVAALAAGLGYHYFGPRPLDGSVWDVKIRRAALLSWPRRATLAFDRGRLTIEGKAQETSSSRYETRSAGETLQWTASRTGARGERQSWQGAASGDRIEGTVLSTDPDGRTTRLTFRGSRRARS